MENIEKIIAKQLLDIKAVTLNPDNPYTWASGWKSPIYCDNRKMLSSPSSRKNVTNAFVEVINKHFKDVDVIAGVATGAIAWGVMVAEALNKSFIYVRPKPKDHGTNAQVEGIIEKNQKVVLVEDLISTGKSSLSAAEALHASGAIVLGMVAIFSYNFASSRRSFEYANVELHTLCQYDSLLEEAVEEKYVKESDLEMLKEWRIDPSVWSGLKK